MNNKKHNRVDAYLSDEAYEAFKNGDAVSNNGLRTPKGNFFSDQPEFEINNENSEHLKQFIIELLLEAGVELVKDTIIPMAKDFFNSKLYPAFIQKFDEYSEHHLKKKNNCNTKQANQNPNNIINLYDYNEKIG